MTTPAVRLRRIVPADIARVYQAWTRAELLSRWFVCKPEWTANATSVFRVGGTYRVVMRSKGKTVAVASGEYLEIQPPERLAFTWSSEGRIVVRESVVTVALRDLGGRTELTLTHDLDPTTDAGRAHATGWEGTIDSLERLLAISEGHTNPQETPATHGHD